MDAGSDLDPGKIHAERPSRVWIANYREGGISHNISSLTGANPKPANFKSLLENILKVSGVSPEGWRANFGKAHFIFDNREFKMAHWVVRFKGDLFIVNSANGRGTGVEIVKESGQKLSHEDTAHSHDLWRALAELC